MILDTSAGELLPLAFALAATGAISGLLAGIFGVGGGAVIVPIVDLVLAALGYDDSVRMHLAIGTSLGVIVPTSFRAFMAHRRRAAINMEVLRSWLVPVPLGVGLASFVAAVSTGVQLRATFACLAFLLSLKLIFNLKAGRVSERMPGWPVRALAGIVVGFLSALMGIGGAVLSMTYMTMFGRPIHEAVGTAAAIGVLVAIPGALGYMVAGWGEPGLPPFSLGYVNLLAVAVMIPLSIAVAPYGVRIAHMMSRRQLEVAFGLFLLTVAVRLGVTLFA
ncbi:sulfite exporter TauE/SafE family protein [Propylenella binzhouense]|uniref:Probable membrane transporter protein n=1 Tax=Propylenella binzhouense TaxID=2555902 RepID=A0A964WSN6_9HYPH|nr:sulfite exporter TauE/SafE family protein [Propylenella binzhouense]MYZ47163.1 sulfite exporter TauE/SafE family protein [Propylenella binzhouense]